MQSLPAELIFYICQLCCTDEGSTFRSLRRLSKFFYELTIPLRYHSVAVDDIGTAKAILGHLENQGPHLRKFHHLFLCTDASRELKHKWSASSVLSTVACLLAVASPTLRTLTVVAPPQCFGTAVIAQIFRTSFPLLEEMTIVGMYPYPVASIPLGLRDINTTDSKTNFPRLQYLHLNGNPNPSGLLELCPMQTLFPSLTHLRVSKLSNSEAFLGELEKELCGMKEEQLDEMLRQSRLPSKLRAIEIQLGPEGLGLSLPARRLLNTREQQEDIIARIEKRLRDSTQQPSVAFFVHPRILHKDEQASYACEDARTHWADRLRGGNGCWMFG